MKSQDDVQLQNVTLLSLFSEVLGSIEELEQKPLINESNGASKMQEIMMGQIISETDNESEEPTPPEAEADMLYHKTAVWQENHAKIQLALLQSIKGKGKLPNKAELAHYTGLSRVCINDHLKDDASINLYKGEINKVRLLGSVILSKLTELALQGELKALKMVLDLIGEKQSTSSGSQSKFIQINNTKIDSVVIEQLSPEAANEIEKIVKAEIEKGS
jgi:hypothetical protein